MIFKKPYKFLIKNFRIIHLIIAILSMYLVIKTNDILGFFNEYATSSTLISVVDLSNQLFNSLMFIIPIIVVIGIAIIIYLLHWKEKPVYFYIFNMVIYIAIVISYTYIYSVCKTLEVGVVDIRIVKAIDDVALILFVIQTISSIFFIVRALGFDVKKFNFGKDLELEVSEKDSEEFEFQVNFDSNKTKRNIKKNFRNIKYVYKENKFFINVVAVVSIVLISLSLYLYYGVFNKTYKIGETFETSTLNIKVDNAFLTNKKYNQSEITDNMLVVVRLEAISKYLEDNDLGAARFQLMINNIPFNHTETYSAELNDLGTTYKDQKIGIENRDSYLLVFEIPKDYNDKKMILKYNDINNKVKRIKLNPQKTEKQNISQTVELGKTLNMNNKIVNSVNIQINSIEMNSKMPVYYDFKSTDGINYESYEYLVPSYTDNYDKTVMKLNGFIEYGEDNKNNNLKNLYDFIKYFGSIEYVINGETKIYNATIRRVKPTKVNPQNEIYIEVDKEIEKAESITINFNVRNQVYKYKVK